MYSIGSQRALRKRRRLLAPEKNWPSNREQPDTSGTPFPENDGAPPV